MARLKQFWDNSKELIAIASFAILAASFVLSASTAVKKVTKFEETFEKLASIAEDLTDPNTWLRQYLFNHNIDSTTAKIWSLYTKGLQVIKGDTLVNVPYLKMDSMPTIGIHAVLKPTGKEKILDTLWDFREVQKK